MKKRIITIGLFVLVILFLCFILIHGCLMKNSNNNFIMYIEDIYTANNDTYVTGTISKGSVKLDNKLVIYDVNVQVKGIVYKNEETKEANKGDFVSINLGKLEMNQLKRGMMLSSKNYANKIKKVDMEIKLDDDFKDIITDTSALVFKIGPENYAGTIIMEDGLVATQTGTVTVVFDDFLSTYVDSPVVVKLNGITEIGTGKITKIYKK